jgi:hypothetical protein
MRGLELTYLIDHAEARPIGVIDMSDTTNNTLDALNAEHDALTAAYQTPWHVHNDAISAIPADASLRDMDVRRDKALDVTEAAQADQARVAEKLVRHAERAAAWASERVNADTSDLDALDGDALRRVLDRALASGDESRAVAAARMLDADGDHTAMPRVSATFPEVGVALSILDKYRAGYDADLASMRYMTVRTPADERIAPTMDVARQHAREEAAAAQADIDAQMARQARQAHASSGPVLPLHSSVRKGEGPHRVRRNAPYGY